MKLLPEFQKIVDYYSNDADRSVAFTVAGKCQELALRRPEMSDDEIDDTYARFPGGFRESFRAVLAAYESKRFAHVKRVVKCRLFKDGNKVVCATDDDCKVLDSPEWEWLGPIFDREVEQ